jgi:nicotinamidase-related amidase
LNKEGRVTAMPDFDAVILIDMQDNFVYGLRKGELERITPNQLLILKKCNLMNIPIFVLEFANKGETIEVLLTEIKKSKNYTFITKYSDSGFSSTQLHEKLKALNIKRIFLMGINATYCVMDTARDAIKEGYEIITSNDVISGAGHHDPNNGVSWYRENGVYVDKIHEVI